MHDLLVAQITEALCAVAVAGIIVNLITRPRDPNWDLRQKYKRQAGLHRLYGNHLMATYYDNLLADLEGEET